MRISSIHCDQVLGLTSPTVALRLQRMTLQHIVSEDNSSPYNKNT